MVNFLQIFNKEKNKRDAKIIKTKNHKKWINKQNCFRIQLSTTELII